MANRCMPTQPKKSSSPLTHTNAWITQYIRHEQRNYCILHLVDSVLDLKGNPSQSFFLVNGYEATKTVDERFVQNYMNNLE